jgi:Bax protein
MHPSIRKIESQRRTERLVRRSVGASVGVMLMVVVANAVSPDANRVLNVAVARLQAIAPAAGPRAGQDDHTYGDVTVASLGAVFDAPDYDLESVRLGRSVPRVFLASMPSDLIVTADSQSRKALFIATALPLILQVNETIRQTRQHTMALQLQWRTSGRIAGPDQRWLRQTAMRYTIDPDLVPAELFEVLLWRVDAVPVSLALAQAAIESGWGTSRFAKEGNALFGQRTWDESAGLVPLERADDAGHVVRAFDRLLESVQAYAYNLNTGWAYESFRDRRAGLRASGILPDGLKLAMTLDRYSEKGEAYVRMVRSIIHTNGLQPFDSARLSQVPEQGLDSDLGDVTARPNL